MVLKIAYVSLVTSFLISCGDIVDKQVSNDASDQIDIIAANAAILNDNPLIKNLEGIITLPKEARSLKEYDRYYLVNGDIFEATYIKSYDEMGLIYIVSTISDIPIMCDGGCDMITITGNFSDADNITIFCNGHA